MVNSLSLLAVGRAELYFFVLVLALFFAFSIFKVPLAWGGMLIMIFGFRFAPNRKKDEKSRVDVAPVNGSKVPSFRLRGSIATLMIVGGCLIALFDLWRNGPGALDDAKAYGEVIVHIENDRQKDGARDVKRSLPDYLKLLKEHTEEPQE